MLTLIATCLLAAGATFTPLPEWTIMEIIGGERPGMGYTLLPSIVCLNKMGDVIPCPEPDYSTRITMKRTLAPGQVADPPQNCTLKIETKH